MANKKAKIDKTSLPLINSDNKYYVRYRIVLDKTKDSDWSEVFAISGKTVVVVEGVTSVVTTAGKKVISLVWGGENSSPTYDIFIKWNSGSYEYHGSSTSTNYTLIAPDTATSVDIVIQIGSAQKAISASLKVFEDYKAF